MSAASPSRILSLVFPHLPADRLLLARRRAARHAGSQADAPEAALVVAGKAAHALVVVAMNARAAALGLAPGLPLTTARAMHPDLMVAQADAAADHALLESIAEWCERYTPLVSLDRGESGCVLSAIIALDITGCAHLFGGETAMLAGLLKALDRRGLHAMGAIAGTRSAAAALARYGHLPATGCVVTPGGEGEAMAGLPVAALGLSQSETLTLVRLGLREIGALARAARAPLAARFGEGLLRRLDRILARCDEPISPRRPLPACTAERRFAEPIGHVEDVRRSIAALATDLGRVLDRRGEGARRLELLFFRADGEVRRLLAETGRPVRDPAVFVRLLRERLDGLADPLDPGFGFDIMRLSADSVERLDPVQTGLDNAAREEEALDDLVDRLCARFGMSRVRRLVPQDSHDPERAAVAMPVQRLQGTAAPDWSVWSLPEEAPTRPLRLLDRPERIEAIAGIPDGPPIRFRWRRMLHEVHRAEGPERIAPEWWRKPGEALTRDYFRVEDSGGRRFWVFREGLWQRETQTPLWYMHGLFG